MLPYVLRRASSRRHVVSPDNEVGLMSLLDTSTVMTDETAVSPDYGCPSSSIWLVEFPLPHDVTRLQIFRKMAPVCDGLVVAFKETTYHTSGDEPGLNRLVQVTALCRLKDSVAKTTARKAVATALCDVVMEFTLTVGYDWQCLVAQQTGIDACAEIKNVAWTDMHLRFKLWWLITKENVRSVRSLNRELLLLLAGSAASSAMFRSLLHEFAVQSSLRDPMRINYKLCPRASDADKDVDRSEPWAEQVLDWFAERLPQPGLNRKSLYLWGPAGVGKTRFIARLLAARQCLHRDCNEGFFLQDLAEEYEFVWLDEFVPGFVISRGDFRQQFNKLTGREKVMVRVKGGVQYQVDASGIRTIICSNHEPPDADYFLRRLLVIRAGSPLYGNDAGLVSRGRKQPASSTVHSKRVKYDTGVAIVNYCHPIRL